MMNYREASKYAEKSHVSLATAICPVCGTEHETGELLIDTRLVNWRTGSGALDKYTPTKYELCPEHEALREEYVAIVALEREPYPGEDPMKVPRTGHYMHMRRTVWPHVINVPCPPIMCFVPTEAFDKIKTVLGQS